MQHRRSAPSALALALLFPLPALAQDARPAGPAVEPAASRTARAVTERTLAGMPTVAVAIDGTVSAGGEVLHEPAQAAQGPAAWKSLDAWLARTADGMPKGPVDPDSQFGPLLPREPLAIRADMEARFHYVQKVMERCGGKDARIWRLELVTRSADEKESGRPALLDVSLPTDVHAALEEGEEPAEDASIEVVVRVVQAGAKVSTDGSGRPWSGERSQRFTHDATRVLEYTIGPRSTRDLTEVRERLKKLHMADPERRLTIDPRQGTLVREVVAVIDAARDTGYEALSFVGSYEQP